MAIGSCQRHRPPITDEKQAPMARVLTLRSECYTSLRDEKERCSVDLEWKFDAAAAANFREESLSPKMPFCVGENVNQNHI